MDTANKEKLSKRWLISVFVLVVAGLIFSGYLSAIKLFSGTCAFNESCPYFLGYPACWYGFAMYLAMFIVTLLALAKSINIIKVLKINLAISLLGILFSGSFVVQELMQSQITGVLGLSTCAYGFFMYVAIALVSCVGYFKLRG